jgi:NADPH:quinone reductase-like Zn-dependent oxidoreductase
MKAVLLRSFGGPEVLRLETVPDPVPGAGEIVVRVGAVSVNRTFDLAVRRGTYGRHPVLPLVLGADPSGIVVAAAPDVTVPRIGDRVAIQASIRCGVCAPCRSGRREECRNTKTIGVHRWGGYAEYVAVPAANAVAVPAGLDFAAATVITRHGGPALTYLRDRGGLKSGESVLVMGAAGGLGGFAVQTAKLLGARVTAGAGSDARVAYARALGADDGINYRTQDLAACVLALTGGEGVDLVLETIGDPALWPQALASLGQGGRMVCVGAHGGGTVALDISRLYMRRLTIIGAAGNPRANVEQALSWGAAGRLKPGIARILPLAEAAMAHRLAEDSPPMGKIVLDPTL